jgi:hypothetical protein
MTRWLVRGAVFLLSIVALLVLSLGVYIGMNWEQARRFPKIVSAYYAKEACTCRYVLLRDAEFCHELVRQYVPISSYQEDSARREITVTGLGAKSRARHVDERLGCRIEE